MVNKTDYAGNLGRQLQLIGTWDGKPLEDGFKGTTRKIEEASKKMANKTAGLVNKQMGQAMGAFNEKCLTGDTLVITRKGPKAIRDITTDDVVVAYDMATGETSFAPVAKVHVQGTQAVVDLKDEQGNVVVSCTCSHRWATPDGIQTVLSSKTPGSIKINVPHGDRELFFDLNQLRQAECFDLSIDTPDNLYVLHSGLVTHNTEKGRQLLTAFGGAVGGAAGNVVYYAGTLCLKDTTLVVTQRGPVEIRHIKLTDVVRAYHTKTGHTTWEPVAAIHDQGFQDVIDLKDDAGRVVASCTLIHRWATPSGIQTIQGQTGNSIEILTDTGSQVLHFDREEIRNAQCFDLSIDTPDNLYVLESGLVTHNTYVIGRFKLWELAVMAVLAGIAALVWAITKETEAEKQWNKRIDENVKAMDDLVKSTNEYLATRKQTLEGWSQEEVRIKGVNTKLVDNHEAMQQAIDDMKTWYDTAPTKDIYDKVYPTDKIIGFYKSLFKAQDAQILLTKLHKADAATKEKDWAAEFARRKKAEDDKKKKGRGKGLTGEDFENWIEAENARIDMVEQKAIDRAGREAEAYAQESERMGWEIAAIRQEQFEREEQAQEDHMWRLIALKEREEEAKLDLEKETDEAKNRMMLDGIDIFENMGALLAASEEANTAVKIVAIMARAAWRMAEEIADGVSTSVTQPWVAASHFAAAALYGAIAAGNVASAAGGSGASSSGRAGMQDSRPTTREPGATTINLTITDSVLTGSEAGREIVNKVDEWWNRVNPGRALGRVD